MSSRDRVPSDPFSLQSKHLQADYASSHAINIKIPSKGNYRSSQVNWYHFLIWFLRIQLYKWLYIVSIHLHVSIRRAWVNSLTCLGKSVYIDKIYKFPLSKWQSDFIGGCCANKKLKKYTSNNIHFLPFFDAVINSPCNAKERGRNNFPNYASQLQATFARSQITKISK